MILRILSVLAAVLYPLAVWQLLEHGRTDLAAAVLAAAALLAAASRRSKPALLGAAAAGLLAVKNALKLYPVFVNASLLTVFALSLKGTSIVEKFARLREKELPEYAVRYCRRVTIAWCVFFILNGLVALDSALWRSDAWWGLYNGAVSYVLIGLMFALEFAVRLWVRRRHTRNAQK